MTKTIPLKNLAPNITKVLQSIPGDNNSLLLNKQHYYQNSLLTSWCERTPHPVTLRYLANFGKTLTEEKIISSANFVRTELPVRLALRIRDLQKLPFNFTNNFHISQVYQSYYHCFNAFRKIGHIDTLKENEDFCKFLSSVLDDHLLILPHLMMGALECSILQNMKQSTLDDLMSLMLRSRISRRVIIEQHISLSRSFSSTASDNTNSNTNGITTNTNTTKPSNYIGAAFQYCSAIEHLNICKDITWNFLSRNYPDLQMPELIINFEDLTNSNSKDVKFQFLTNHLDYILSEILRNSLKSTISNFLRNRDQSDKSSNKPPPITVDITNNKKDIIFKISDRGGGMDQDQLSRLFSFGKSTVLAKNYLNNFQKLPGLNLTPRFPVLDENDSKVVKNTGEIIEENKEVQLSGMLHSLGEMETTNPNNKSDIRLASSAEIGQVEEQLDDIFDNKHSISPVDPYKDNKLIQKSALRRLVNRPLEYTLGISLPMCKVYIDYWNGDLDVYSLEGYGTDVYLRLSKLGGSGDKVQLDKA
ncbi:hypothetical protein B5S30_g4472 [[Candida] boidinii]|nr:hypothetical protein B5S30_g4472 [[Candida] boidinii]